MPLVALIPWWLKWSLLLVLLSVEIWWWWVLPWLWDSGRWRRNEELGLTLSSLSSQSCELGTSQCVGCPATAPSRAQCWPWRVLLQSLMERSLQEAFVVQELFCLKYLHCSCLTATCLQLISYLQFVEKANKEVFFKCCPPFLCPLYLSCSPEGP